jgi:hypothetical protein
MAHTIHAPDDSWGGKQRDALGFYRLKSREPSP